MGTERGNVLLEAHKIINGDRQQSYGNPEDTHGVIAELWNGYMRAKNATIWGADAEPMRLPTISLVLEMIINAAGSTLFIKLRSFMACPRLSTVIIIFLFL